MRHPEHAFDAGSTPGDRRVERQSMRYEERRLELIAREVFGATVLDLGHAQWPNPYLRGEHTVGLDLWLPSEPTGYSRDVVGSVYDLRGLFPNERFDTVIAAELIEHLERPYDFLRIIHDVLAPDGRLILSTPNPMGFPTFLLEWTRSKRWFYTTDHVYYFLPRWVERMLDLTGFELERMIPVGLWLPRGYLPWCPIALSYQVIYVASRRP